MYRPSLGPYCDVLSCLKTVCHATHTDHLCGLIVVCCLVLKLCIVSHVQTTFVALVCCLVLKLCVVPHVQTISGALLWWAVLS